MSASVVELSVVIPTYRDAMRLERMLRSLDAQDTTTPFEVIVVDDCSGDDTEETVKSWIAEEHSFQAQYIGLEENQGPGHARNVGLHAAQGRIIVYIDSDCVAEPSWLRHLPEKVDVEKKIIGVGGRVFPLSEGSMPARHFAFTGALEPPFMNQYLVTCNCCFVREALLAVGGFPEDIPIAGGEDIEASILLYKAGWRFEFEEHAVIHHDFNPDLRAYARVWRNYGFGNSIVSHRCLTDEERHPEWGIMEGENYWSGQCIRPTITGFRSIFYDLRHHYHKCRAEKLSAFRTLEFLLLQLLGRFSFYIGWRQGLKVYRESVSKSEV
jgi:glycosyltransferase involved in cell wall biosynthesis